MSDTPSRADREMVRQHTAKLRELLRGRRTASGAPAPPEPKAVVVPSASTAPANPPAGPRHPERSEAERSKEARSRPATGAGHGPLLAVAEHLRRPQGGLAALLDQSTQLTEMTRIARAFLPSPLADHVFLTGLDPDGWVVQTDSPAWATRLRYALPGVRRDLAAHLGRPVPPLRVRIVPAAVAPPPPPPRRMRIPETAVALLESAAQGLADRRLRAALLRLARHARQRDRTV